MQHLLMYHVATRRDLDDVATIEEFCRGVRGREGLRNLYLLTVADLSTTSPTAMTSWKARMLDELYFAAEAHLAGQEPRADAERVARVRDAVRAAWRGRRSRSRRFSSTMPERYLLANAPESIVQHAKVVAERDGAAAHVGRVTSRHPEAAELCVVADDRPGLLASIAAAITASRLEVLAAQVYSRTIARPRARQSTSSGCATATAAPTGSRRRCRGWRATSATCARCGSIPRSSCAPAPGRRRRGGSVPARRSPRRSSLDDRASPRHTVVEVFAKDRPGLLFTLSHALHELGLSIALSKINTEGRASPTSSTWASSTAPRSRGARATTRSTKPWCAPSKAESLPFTGASPRWEDGVA